MKRIVLTGGGSGGHFFPLLAVLEEILSLKDQYKEEEIEIFYMGEKNENTSLLEEKGVKVIPIVSSKIRRYFSLANFFEIPKFIIGFLQSWIRLYFIMPDIIFSKGGPGSLPVILAGTFYMIPIFIHESDSLPSLTTKISSRFAKKIYISFSQTKEFLKSRGEIILTGNPIRKKIISNQKIYTPEEAKKELGFEKDLPLLLVIGGSQGAKRLNNFIFDNFEKILHNFQVLHQVGKNNMEESDLIYKSLSKEISSFYLENYKMVPFLSEEDLVIALSAAQIVLSRAGAGAIFEIALFGKPSILVPLPEAAQDHQRLNAYEYERSGAAFVLEEKNLEFSSFLVLANKILQNRELYEKMRQAAFNFAKINAAQIIAEDIMNFINKK